MALVWNRRTFFVWLLLMYMPCGGACRSSQPWSTSSWYMSSSLVLWWNHLTPEPLSCPDRSALSSSSSFALILAMSCVAWS